MTGVGAAGGYCGRCGRRTNFGVCMYSDFAFGVGVGFGVCVAFGFDGCFACTLCFALGECVADGCGLTAGVTATALAPCEGDGEGETGGAGVGVGLPGSPTKNGPTAGSALAEFRNALRPFQLSANAVNATTMIANATNASVDRRDHLRPKSLNTRIT